MEAQAKVYLAEIVLALEHMHRNGVIHRCVAGSRVALTGRLMLSG